jgi:glycosyltransferase involved in cell wall biosynthesis
MVVHLHGGAGIRLFMLDKSSWRRRVNEFFLRRLGGVIVLGRRQLDVFANSVAREKVHIVPNFAEDYLFADELTIRNKFQNPQPLRLLFLSNMLPGKGHLELIDAFLSLDDTTKKNLVIDFAGGFESDEQKNAFLGKIEGVTQFRYHGTVRGDRKKELLHSAHVFCLPTYYPYEGQPISILEAFASGCVVITTDHSGILDVFADQINGYEVKKASAPDLKRAIEAVVANREGLHAIAVTNRESADRNYRTAIYNSRLLDIVDSLASAPPHRDA